MRWAFLDKPHRIIPVRHSPCDREEFHPRLPLLHEVDFTHDARLAGRKLLADMMQRLHEQAREQAVKVEEISKDNEQLKELLFEAGRKEKDAVSRVRGALGFDGSYAHVPF